MRREEWLGSGAEKKHESQLNVVLSEEINEGTETKTKSQARNKK